MEVTLQEVVRRLADLERDVADLKRSIGRARVLMPSLSRAEVDEAWRQALAELGPVDASMTVEQLRESIIAGGVNPDDNLASREIMAMREE
jgi:hypothetical protein